MQLALLPQETTKGEEQLSRDALAAAGSQAGPQVAREGVGTD